MHLPVVKHYLLKSYDIMITKIFSHQEIKRTTFVTSLTYLYLENLIWYHDITVTKFWLLLSWQDWMVGVWFSQRYWHYLLEIIRQFYGTWHHSWPRRLTCTRINTGKYNLKIKKTPILVRLIITNINFFISGTGHWWMHDKIW